MYSKYLVLDTFYFDKITWILYLFLQVYYLKHLKQYLKYCKIYFNYIYRKYLKHIKNIVLNTEYFLFRQNNLNFVLVYTSKLLEALEVVLKEPQNVLQISVKKSWFFKKQTKNRFIWFIKSDFLCHLSLLRVDLTGGFTQLTLLGA